MKTFIAVMDTAPRTFTVSAALVDLRMRVIDPSGRQIVDPSGHFVVQPGGPE